MVPRGQEQGLTEVTATPWGEMKDQTDSASGVVAPTDSAQRTQWGHIVRQIQAGEPEGQALLFQGFERGLRYFIWRRGLAAETEDILSEVFLMVVKAIQGDQVHHPENLPGFVRTVAQRCIAQHVAEAIHKRQHQVSGDAWLEVPDECDSPEDGAIAGERREIAKKVLGSLSARDREVLRRFYLQGQTAGQICEEMALSETQFRLLKSRAKEKFRVLGQAYVRRKSPQRYTSATLLSFAQAAG